MGWIWAWLLSAATSFMVLKASALFKFAAICVSACGCRCIAEGPTETLRTISLRKQLHRSITTQLDNVRLNGDPRHTLPGTLNLSFAQTDADSILLAMPDVALSSGSACTSAKAEPSHVLKAMGVSDELARASI